MDKAFAVLTVGQIASMLWMSTKDICENMDSLKKSISEMEGKIKQYNKTYENVISGVEVLDAQTKSKIDSLIDDITNLNFLIKVDKQNFQDRYRASQILGLTFCATIAFVFICKIFGVDKIINEVIKAPFIWLSNLFSKDK